MISALMVSRRARLALAAEALADFAAQTHADRELLVVHDDGAGGDRDFGALAARHPEAAIRVLAVAPGRTLGELRNEAVAAAAGSHVCQWDDDDRHHPQRMALQWQALHDDGADACFLVDQLHAFLDSGELGWDDWGREPYPLDLVQGTLLARREAMPAYPALARGEDTALLLALLRAGARIVRLRGVGWCYVYRFHGGNVFAAGHHRAITAAKGLDAAALLNREALLRRRLAEYAPPLPRLRAIAAPGLVFG